MNEIPKTNRGWRIARRILIALAVFATLIAVFYTEEDWRGKHDWERCKAQMEAKGIVMDWNKYIPPAIPDDENIFKAPKMTEWFVKGRVTTNGATWFRTNEFVQKLQSTNGYLTTSVGSTNNLISTPEIAQKYLDWSDEVFQPDFNLMREALKRPNARMDGDYSAPYEIPIPNFVAVRAVAQVLAQRAHCYLLLNQPDNALDELTLLHNLRGIMQPPPNGRPETLVAAMINVAVAGLYVNVIQEGFEKNAWQEPQLAPLQKQLADTDLAPWVWEAMKTEPVAFCRDVETENVFRWETSNGEKWPVKFADEIKTWLWPRGWTYQNMVTVMTLDQPSIGFDADRKIISPKIFDLALRNLEKSLTHKTPYNIIAGVGIPNFKKAWQVTAYNQTMVNEAQVVCALERFHLANGNYPESLDALTPQFMEKIPQDIIGGGQLIYRRAGNEKFLLYSIGWNEVDDGGQLSPTGENNWIDYAQGDWVWKN